MKSLLEDKEIVKNEENGDENANLWWSDMDAEAKVDIVRNINLSLREIGCYSCKFVVVTKYIHKQDGIKTSTIPVFMGTMYEPEFEIIQGYAIELQTNMNFNNFVFNCKVVAYY